MDEFDIHSKQKNYISILKQKRINNMFIQFKTLKLGHHFVFEDFLVLSFPPVVGVYSNKADIVELKR